MGNGVAHMPWQARRSVKGEEVVVALEFNSSYIDTQGEHRLHIMQVSEPELLASACSGVVLMIHGMIEDGRIFYHPSGKGLASYLARQGYLVLVADLRGIGQSRPAINKHSRHGQTESIVEDIPALIEYASGLSANTKLHLVAHSWGGVLLNSALVRFPALNQKVHSGVYFGSKRNVRAKNWDRVLKIELMWNTLGTVLGAGYGYLPALKYKIGAQNETRQTHRQTVRWIKRTQWIDSHDGFDYQQAANALEQAEGLAPILYYGAVNDLSLGNPKDVERFMLQSGVRHAQYRLLSRANGNSQDYDHLSMLTAPDCINDHFSDVSAWLANKGAD